MYVKTIKEFIKNGAYFSKDQLIVEKFRNTLFDSKGLMNKL